MSSVEEEKEVMIKLPYTQALLIPYSYPMLIAWTLLDEWLGDQKAELSHKVYNFKIFL